ncbi:MAG: PD-(D/E)XK nuclease family protein [Planctomycetota bacterium JB042]
MSSPKKPRRSQLWVSPSQIENYLLCNRKWWFKSVAKLAEVMKGSTTFGTVLHAVAERYLRADDTGRGPDGKPVDLYPPGWEVAKERDGSTKALDEIEQGFVRRLIDQAIEQGILARMPGRKVEFEFKFPVAYSDDGELEILAVGYIDELLPLEVSDHKTTKNMRYAKSARALKKSVQMMLYAKVALERMREQGSPLPESLTLTHKVYCKNPDDLRVRRTRAKVTPAEVEQFWTSTIVPTSRRMLDTKKTYSEWHDVPQPEDLAKACNAYGGCSYAPICTGRETPDQYRKRLEIHAKRAHTPSAQSTPNRDSEGDPKVNIFQKRLDARRQASNGATAAPAVNGGPSATEEKPAPAPAPAAAEAAPADAPSEAPPWARSGCEACKGTGFNSKGAPCRICDSMQRTEGKVTSADFVIVAEGDGTVVWEPKAGDAAAGSAEVAGTGGDVTVEEKEQPPEVEPEVAAPPKEKSPEESGAEVPEPKDVVPQRPRGRPPKSFTLCIGCAPTRVSGKTISLDQVFAKYAAQVAESQGAESYYVMDAFRRRDILCAGAEKIATEFGSAVVIAVPQSPDTRAFVEALRPYAQFVFEGVAG